MELGVLTPGVTLNGVKTMTIVSTNVGLTDTAEGTDYNNLRADLLDNHIHDGTDGPAVDHSDLIHPDSYSIVNEHEAVDSHIAAVKNEHGKETTTGDEFIAGAVGGDFTIVPFSAEFGHTVDSSGDYFEIDFSAIVTMANTDYRVFWSFLNYDMLWAKLTSRTTTTFTLEIFTKKSDGNVSGTKTFHVLLVGVPARP